MVNNQPPNHIVLSFRWAFNCYTQSTESKCKTKSPVAVDKAIHLLNFVFLCVLKIQDEKENIEKII